jgi:hypothetical protein
MEIPFTVWANPTYHALYLNFWAASGTNEVNDWCGLLFNEQVRAA